MYTPLPALFRPTAQQGSLLPALGEEAGSAGKREGQLERAADAGPIPSLAARTSLSIPQTPNRGTAMTFLSPRSNFQTNLMGKPFSASPPPPPIQCYFSN